MESKLNIVCTCKPCDGLLYYSYEHCSYLNSIGIHSQLIIITHYNFKKEDYIKAIKNKYIHFKDVIFDEYNPKFNEITLIMGRSMLTLAYLNKKNYTMDQNLTIHLLFKNKLISIYSENHPIEYDIALKYFSPKKIFDLCDFDIYPNGVGKNFKKTINFKIYKSFSNNIQFKYLFNGTNKNYYKSIQKVIKNYPSHGILTHNEDYIDNNNNNLFVPVEDILSIFETYVYTKEQFDPAPRIMQECKYFNKEFIYLRNKNLIDGGSVYYKREALDIADKKNSDNINILINMIKVINEKNL